MIKIAVCDDAELISQGVKQTIEEHVVRKDIEVDAFTTGREIYEGAIKNRYDIILMDIELDSDSGETGMEISERIKSVYPDVLIVFITGAAGYERKLLNFEPFRFITKPFSDEELLFAVNKAIKRVEGWGDKYFVFKDNGIGHKKRLRDIIFFCSSYPFVEVVCMGESARFRGKIDEVEEELSALSNDFLRPNKSFLVNRKYVASYSSKEVIMINGERVAVSRKHKEAF
ncbi:MAG: response regulator transcription factor [Lachnospiraceae bacterium]|nr:response regulator transcription factor [Lachnospiraceae bacterium]